MNVKKFLVCFVACLLCLSLPMMSYASEKNAEYTDAELIELASKGVYVDNSYVKVTPVNENEVTFKVTDDSVERVDTNFVKIIEKGRDGKANNARVTGCVTVYSDDFAQTRGGVYDEGSYGRLAYATVEMTYTSKTFYGLLCKKPTHVSGQITSVASGISVPIFNLIYSSSGFAYDSNGNDQYTDVTTRMTYSNTFQERTMTTEEPYYLPSNSATGAFGAIKASVKNSSTGSIYGELEVKVYI